MTEQDKHHENETEGYKAFLPVARKIKKIDYKSKWRIVPDMSDPLRRFTLERDIEWATLKVVVRMESTYHRGYDVPYSEKYYYKPIVMVGGLFQGASGQVQYISLGMRVKPRMAKKVIEAIDTVIIPKFYNAIKQDQEMYEKNRVSNKKFNDNVAKVKGLTVKHDEWGGYAARLSKCVFEIGIHNNEQDVVTLSADMTYDDFAKLAEHNGWGK